MIARRNICTSAARFGTALKKDAILLDRESGVFGDPSKVHLLNFEGEHFRCRGPLPALPSPQGRPVIIQAGQSGPGLDLAAHYRRDAIQHATHARKHERSPPTS